METWRPLVERAAILEAAIEATVQSHRAAFTADRRRGVARSVLADGLELAWGNLHLSSLWLLSQCGLRRAGLRRHDHSDAVLLGWRGNGLVLLRPAGERRSLELVAHDRPPNEAGERCVVVGRETLYDTLADAAPWHLLVFHSHAARGLKRSEPNENGWTEIEEAS